MHLPSEENSLTLEPGLLGFLGSNDYFSGGLLDKRGFVNTFAVKGLEKVTNHVCPRCGRQEMNIYYSDQTDNRVGAWCEHCNLKAYYYGEELVPINTVG